MSLSLRVKTLNQPRSQGFAATTTAGREKALASASRVLIVIGSLELRRQGGAFENYFGARGRKFERSNLQKFKCPWFVRGEDVEVSS